MEQTVKIFEDGKYKVFASKDGTNSMLVQIVKFDKRRKRDKDGNVSIEEYQEVMETHNVFFTEKDKLRPFSALDNQFEAKISECIRKVKDMHTIDAMGNNLLNKAKSKVESGK